MPNIADIIEVAEELEGKAVIAVPERCVAVRNRNSSCTKCIDACLADAIEVHNNALSVNAAACVSCGACSVVCPTEALVSTEPFDEELERAAARAMDAAGEGRAVVACARIAARGLADPRKFAEVPCMARVGESLLVGLAACGAQSITLVDGDCSTCKYRATSPGVDATVASTDALLAAQGLALRVERASEFPAGLELADSASLLGEARRGFFTSAGSWTASAAEKTANLVIRKNLGMKPSAKTLREQLGAGKGGSLPQLSERRHAQVLDAMDRLGQPAVEVLHTRLFGRVSIDASGCNACGMCAVFCPTGALSKSAIKPSPNADGTPDGGSFLEFSAADCVQCGLCVDACMKKCLILEDDVPLSELFDFEPRFIYLPKPGRRPGILSSFKK